MIRFPRRFRTQTNFDMGLLFLGHISPKNTIKCQMRILKVMRIGEKVREASLTLLHGACVIVLCKVYGTVEHPETNFPRYVFRKKRFFNPTNTTKFSASGGEKIVLIVGLKYLLFLHVCVTAHILIKFTVP